MLLITIGIVILIFIILEKKKIKINNKDVKDLCEAGMVFLFSFFIVTLMILAICIGYIVTSINVDDKITIYTEQNKKIENQLEIAIEKYEGYEKDTYKDLKANTENANVVMLAQTFPELKSNELVQKQIEVYIDNNNTIKMLQEKKVNARTCMWFICFVNKF